MLEVIPAPLQVTPDAGQFRFSVCTRVEFRDAALSPLIQRFCREVSRRTGAWLDPVVLGRGALAEREPAIVVELIDDPTLHELPTPIGVSPLGAVTADERYELTISAARIVVRAIQPVGLARAFTTLLQLVGCRAPGPAGEVVVPAARIFDAPRFAWRGLTLDLAGAYFTLADIKRVVDLVALYKLNVLHLHLTDDRGWRIEAARPPSHQRPDGTFYTNAELRDLVEYAGERFVTLLPEFDSPGHATAILRMRPELATGRNQLELQRAPGWVQRSAWLDPDLPATFAIVEKVLDELAEIFPGPFIDIGADEPFGMPDELYVKYVSRERAYLRSLGKRSVGWQESVRAIADPDHVIQYRIGSNGGASSTSLLAELPPMVGDNVLRLRSDLDQALKHSVPVIVSPLSHAYLDVPYAEDSVDADQERLRKRLGMHAYSPSTIAQNFDWEPAEALGGNGASAHVAGVGAAIWAETIYDFSDLTFLLLPRLASAAQKAWGQPGETWAAHRQRLAVHGRLWEQDGLVYFRSSLVDWKRSAVAP